MEEGLEAKELVQPLDPTEAGPLARRILKDGRVVIVSHAKDRMEKRVMDSTDIANVIRCGTVEYPDNVGGRWRYRISTPRMTVVVEFRTRECIVVVTGWRN